MLELTLDHTQEIIRELSFIKNDLNKDILIVVKNQLELFEKCIKSIENTTENYTLYIWDNDSNQSTKEFLKTIKNAHIISHDENIGFIKPNNNLIKLGSSPYVILLNSDTIVSPNWDKALIGCLESNPDIGVTGYRGAILNDKLEGSEIAFGYEADYVEGWCLCFKRDTYNKHGLFDENLHFAYCEDADFCLKLKENNFKSYVLHLNLVLHIGHATIKEVGANVESFTSNHKYMQQKWLDKLKLLRNFNRN